MLELKPKIHKFERIIIIKSIHIVCKLIAYEVVQALKLNNVASFLMCYIGGFVVIASSIDTGSNPASGC